jgi:hypothetical protein
MIHILLILIFDIILFILIHLILYILEYTHLRVIFSSLWFQYNLINIVFILLI